MTTIRTYRSIVWIDVVSPTDEEISGIIKRYSLHPLVGEELKSSSTLAKIDFYKDYILVVLTLPVRVRQNGSYTIADREVDFVIGKNFLITSRTDTVEQLEYFSKIFETNAILNKDEKIEHGGHLFYYMVKRIYGGMCEDLENIRDALVAAESSIFGGDERRMVEVLSNISRELIDFRQTARMHRDIWEELIAHDTAPVFGPDFEMCVHDVHDQFNVIHELITNARELLADLRETNNSLLNSKQNEIVKVLTLVASVFYPLGFIAAVFTIPAVTVPFIHTAYGWAAILLMMVLVAAGMIWYFKKKRWV